MNKKNLILFLYFFFLKEIISYPCKEITVNPFEPTQISIIKNTTSCVLFPFNNKIQGDIILKLAKSNSFTSKIYIYENKEDIYFDKTTNEFYKYKYQYQIGQEFYKEKKLENMDAKIYYIVIYEPFFYFNDELIIYNDKFNSGNYYELNKVKHNDIKELNFKYEYTNENPIIIHFQKESNNINYLSYQILNKNEDEYCSFYVYKNNLDENNLIEKVVNSGGYGNYVNIKGNNDFYIKIIMKGEIDLILRFMDSKVLEITKDDIFTKEIISKMDFYFFIEKELIYENDEYFNEFTIKLDSTNFKNLPFEISTSTCDKKSEEDLLKCISEKETGQKSVIKRDIDIPYIYHVFYSFNNKNYIVIKISSKNNFKDKQRLIIESSGGNTLIDERYDKVFRDNKGYLYPVYLNVSITNINNEFNRNKNKLFFIYTNTTSAIKIFFNEDSFKDDTNIEFKKNEYISIDNYVYGFDFNTKETQELFQRRQYFTIKIYCPWESSPINFQLTFANHNLNNFNYILDNIRPISSPIKIDLSSPNEKYYFIGQYNVISSNILFNEIIYGKINAKYKYFTNDQKISKIIYNETALGKSIDNWIPIESRIDIIEMTCLSPSLSYMYFIDDKAININDIILEKGSQKYIFLNSTNYYEIKLDENLKGQKNINIEVYIVSQVEKQKMNITINNVEYTLIKDNVKENYFMRINTGNEQFNQFGIKGMATATLIRVKIGTEKNDKNIAYYYKYEKELNKNIFSKDKKISIKNTYNNKEINLCYTYNFFEDDILFKPKNENCFSLKGNQEITLTMYNPWNKYLSNENNLFKNSDNYYFVIYCENEEDEKNLEFSVKDENLVIGAEMKENEFINMNNSQFNLIKSTNKENQTILVQISPIIDVNNIINAKNDKFEIIYQMDNNKDGKIYSQKNRTYILYNDPLIDSFLSLEINSGVQYEIKYNIISNKKEFKNDKINDNYEIELVNENNADFIKLQPLLKNKDVIYYILIFFGNENINLGVTYLKNIINNGNSDSIYILKEEKNTKDDIIKISLNSDIANKIKKEKCLITVLAEEKTSYNIIMNYDILLNYIESKNEGNGKSVGFIIAMIFLCLFVICLIVIIGYIAYYFCLKKKTKTDEELLKDIKGVDVAMDDESSMGLNK